MGVYAKLAESWDKQDKALWKERLIKWRREPSTIKLDYPTRLDRARSLGYSAKQGIFIARQRVLKGGHVRPGLPRGRKSKSMRIIMALRKNYQFIAEERANKQFHNCEVLNSYFVAEDGQHYWFEVILADPMHPSVKASNKYSWLENSNSRVFRGRTSAGRRTRGLMGKGKGHESARPSRRANKRHQ